MRKLTMFMQKTCPYCKQAMQWQKELMDENERYRNIEIDIIDEREQPELAESYDYYYVPTYFASKEKLHEGAASKEKIRAVLNAALEG
ncbi:MAG: thioredoxin family protein [Oscillospiraceae bacterium]